MRFLPVIFIDPFCKGNKKKLPVRKGRGSRGATLIRQAGIPNVCAQRGFHHGVLA
jgi:hypothetical protein